MDNRTINEVRKNETRLIIEIKQLEQENQGLKKQLDDYKSRYITGLNSNYQKM